MYTQIRHVYKYINTYTCNMYIYINKKILKRTYIYTTYIYIY